MKNFDLDSLSLVELSASEINSFNAGGFWRDFGYAVGEFFSDMAYKYPQMPYSGAVH